MKKEECEEGWKSEDVKKSETETTKGEEKKNKVESKHVN